MLTAITPVSVLITVGAIAAIIGIITAGIYLYNRKRNANH
jgi:hypothetical protein